MPRFQLSHSIHTFLICLLISLSAQANPWVTDELAGNDYNAIEESEGLKVKLFETNTCKNPKTEILYTTFDKHAKKSPSLYCRELTLTTFYLTVVKKPCEECPQTAWIPQKVKFEASQPVFESLLIKPIVSKPILGINPEDCKEPSIRGTQNEAAKTCTPKDLNPTQIKKNYQDGDVLLVKHGLQINFKNNDTPDWWDMTLFGPSNIYTELAPHQAIIIKGPELEGAISNCDAADTKNKLYAQDKTASNSLAPIKLQAKKQKFFVKGSFSPLQNNHSSRLRIQFSPTSLTHPDHIYRPVDHDDPGHQIPEDPEDPEEPIDDPLEEVEEEEECYPSPINPEIMICP